MAVTCIFAPALSTKRQQTMSAFSLSLFTCISIYKYVYICYTYIYDITFADRCCTHDGIFRTHTHTAPGNGARSDAHSPHRVKHSFYRTQDKLATFPTVLDASILGIASFYPKYCLFFVIQMKQHVLRIVTSQHYNTKIHTYMCTLNRYCILYLFLLSVANSLSPSCPQCGCACA